MIKLKMKIRNTDAENENGEQAPIPSDEFLELPMDGVMGRGTSPPDR